LRTAGPGCGSRASGCWRAPRGRLAGRCKLIAARQAADLLEGTLYATYFDIDCDLIRRFEKEMHAGASSRVPPRGTAGFAALCMQRAGVSWDHGILGMGRIEAIFEQEQILTTQNLASIFLQLRLQDRMAPQLAAAAQRLFMWICRRHQMVGSSRARREMIPNTAYAWRQMIFFLALLPQAEQAQIVARCAEIFSQQAPMFRWRFGPAMKGLQAACKGYGPGSAHAQGMGARQFLGWPADGHWLFAYNPNAAADT
jgi:hypothetical protein